MKNIPLRYTYSFISFSESYHPVVSILTLILSETTPCCSSSQIHVVHGYDLVFSVSDRLPLYGHVTAMS